MYPAAHIVIDLAVLSSPIEGSLFGDDRAPVTFTGYMQLITAIENAVQAARERIADGEPSVSVQLSVPPLPEEQR